MSDMLKILHMDLNGFILHNNCRVSFVSITEMESDFCHLTATELSICVKHAGQTAIYIPYILPSMLY